MKDRLGPRIIIFSLIPPVISYLSVLVFWPLYLFVGAIFQPLWFYDTDRYGGHTTFHATHQGWFWAAGYSLFVGSVAAALTRHKTFSIGIAATFGVAIVASIITHIIVRIVAPSYTTVYP